MPVGKISKKHVLRKKCRLEKINLGATVGKLSGLNTSLDKAITLRHRGKLVNWRELQILEEEESS